jgi:hypothetical protein
VKQNVLIAMFMAAVIGSGSIHAETGQRTSKASRTEIRQTTAGKPLGEFLRSIEKRSGIRFRVPPELAGDKIDAPAIEPGMKPTSIRDLLQGYNYLAELGDSGRIREITVTGRNGDGAMPPTSAEAPSIPAAKISLFTYRSASLTIPEKFRSYARGSVRPISVSLRQLRAMGKGTRVSIDLPGGPYEAIHDNVWQHENGETTWVGYVGAQPGRYRAVLTLGDDGGVTGQILTPDGLYTVESEDGQNWLVDVGAAGLQRGSFEADESIPAADSPQDSGGQAAVPEPASSPAPGVTAVASLAGPAVRQANERMNKLAAQSYPARATVSNNGRAVIDLLVLYTPGMTSANFSTKLNNLVALANQAYLDSRAKVTLRLTAAKPVDYPNGGDNAFALDDLTNGHAGLGSVRRVKTRKGADVVALLRPFRPGSQGGCGTAWVNGADGGELRADLAYAVISVGARDGYYCSNYALAHEIGHVLGATHDREHARVAGRFPYSYGYGIEGRFGDIMSYYDPEVGLFANPDLLDCDGAPCGIPDVADVVQTFNNTAKTVSGFAMPVSGSGSMGKVKTSR